MNAVSSSPDRSITALVSAASSLLYCLGITENSKGFQYAA